MSDEADHLTLKWGTLKGWKFSMPEAKPLLERYYEIGHAGGAMQQHDTAEQREIICKLIDLCPDPEGIYLDWDGKYVTKDEAKKYVMEYARKRAAA